MRKFIGLAFVAWMGCGSGAGTPVLEAGVGADASAIADGGHADLAQADGPAGATDLASTPGYAVPGPYAVTTQELSATLTAGTLTLTAYLPTTADKRPLVVVAPGFVQGRAGYAAYGQRLASHGLVTLIFDDAGFNTSSATEASELTELVSTWLPAQALAAKIELDHVGLMGHSRGGQVALLAAEGGLAGKVIAFFGLDPVDTNNGIEARTALPTIGIPTVFLGETLDGTGSFGMACAPTADNYQAQYAFAPSPSLELTAVGAAHFDFEDRSKATLAGLCMQGAADPATVLAMAVTISTGYFDHQLAGASLASPYGADVFVAAGQLVLTSK